MERYSQYGQPTPFPNEALLDKLSNQLAREESMSTIDHQTQIKKKAAHVEPEH